MYAPEHWSGSCRTGCYGPVFVGDILRCFDCAPVILAFNHLIFMTKLYHDISLVKAAGNFFCSFAVCLPWPLAMQVICKRAKTQS